MTSSRDVRLRNLKTGAERDFCGQRLFLADRAYAQHELFRGVLETTGRAI